MAPRLYLPSMPIRVFSRSAHVAGLVILRQTFVRHRHRPTIFTSCCTPTAPRGASGIAAASRRRLARRAPEFLLRGNGAVRLHGRRV
jgi:hypothetical protein